MPLFTRSVFRTRRKGVGDMSMLRHLFYGVLTIVIATLVGLLLWYLTRLPVFSILSVSVEGGETISHDTVRAIVEEGLRGSYLGLIPFRFTYLYPEGSIQEKLLNIPRVRSVELSRDSSRLLVSFTEYVPYALWCLSLDEASPCYFMDTNGYAFAPSPPLRGGTLVRYVHEAEAELSEKQIFSKDELIQSAVFLEALTRGRGFRVSAITYTRDGDIIYHLLGGGDIMTAPKYGTEESYRNLATVLGAEEFKNITPGNFKYIDLRFGTKVFVNETTEPQGTTTSEIGTSTATTTDEVLPGV